MKSRVFGITICIAILFSAFATLTTAQEMSGPSPEHKVLKKDVGEWSATLKIWGPGSDEAMTSKGSEKTEMVSDMWSISKFKGEIMGQSFTGYGTFGYDPTKKKFIGTWFDSTTPYMSQMEGTYDKKTETMTWMTTGTDAATGKPQKGKNVVQYKDKDTRVFTMHMLMPDDTYFKALEISYKRN